MRVCFALFIYLTSAVVSNHGYTSRDIRCLVCQNVVVEMEKEINKISPTKKVLVGGYRVDDEGNIQQRKVPLVQSEGYLYELMESVCDKMDNYVRATDKKTGELVLLQLLLDSGGMNPNISDVDIIQDSDLNKSLKFHCEGVLEEYESEFLGVLSSPLTDNIIMKICGESTHLCDSEVFAADNNEDSSRLSNEKNEL